ncbi:hypothetical protein LEP1GSC178_1485 [Leptospira licerasiae str. MMD4847]|uniref:Uncharacterized protein n=1 Tax=Leptospira licerasiae str. MMD4847 TaxID=1049971 RepID=A0ABN0H4K0_9LEPT|nr:hypothetical protein LEP1GSC178_1485 [Leptospira licerasiae str. MMD4847]
MIENKIKIHTRTANIAWNELTKKNGRKATDQIAERKSRSDFILLMIN